MVVDSAVRERRFWPADGPRLFYSRSFPGSTPAYFDVTVESNGDAVYREAVDDELPAQSSTSPKPNRTKSSRWPISWTTSSARSNRRPKVAFMGTKTFRYEEGAEKTEVKFNYTEDLDGQRAAGLVRTHGRIGPAPR